MIKASIVDNPEVDAGPPREIDRDEFIRLIKSGVSVYLVNELLPGKYAPMTRVQIETIAGVDYLKATVEHGPFDDLG